MSVRTFPATALKIFGLGLFAFAIFGPLTNLLLWSVAERWYTPFKLRRHLWHPLLGGCIPSDR